MTHFGMQTGCRELKNEYQWQSILYMIENVLDQNPASNRQKEILGVIFLWMNTFFGNAHLYTVPQNWILLSSFILTASFDSFLIKHNRCKYDANMYFRAIRNGPLPICLKNKLYRLIKYKLYETLKYWGLLFLFSNRYSF